MGTRDALPDPIGEQQSFDRFVNEVLLPLRQRIVNFDDPKQQWRRVASELIGTFFLVLVAAGAPMVNVEYPGSIGRAAAVVAPGLMVMAMIMFMGRVSGAHFNPTVSLAFALRGEFPWRRVPGYLAAQCAGGLIAVFMLEILVHTSARWGATTPGHGVSNWAAIGIEAILTMGLLSVILGTASGAQQVGILGAVAVGAYIALAGLWAAPLSGASMNPIRSITPDLASVNFRAWYVYLVGPLVGMLFAVAMAWVLRGSGRDQTAAAVAQGSFVEEIASKALKPDQP